MTRVAHSASGPATGEHLTSATTLRLSITQLPHPGHQTKDVVLRLEGSDRDVLHTLWAWASVRQYDDLANTVEGLFTQPPPAAGFTAILHKPHALLILVRWSWAPPARTLSF